MMTRSCFRLTILTAVSGLLGTLSLAGAAMPAAQAATSLPCAIYAAAGTPRVAAHSTVRALYAGSNGPLYEVKRASDGAAPTNGALQPGGTPDAPAQDSAP